MTYLRARIYHYDEEIKLPLVGPQKLVVYALIHNHGDVLTKVEIRTAWLHISTIEDEDTHVINITSKFKAQPDLAKYKIRILRKFEGSHEKSWDVSHGLIEKDEDQRYAK